MPPRLSISSFTAGGCRRPIRRRLAGGGCDRLQPGDAGADHEHLTGAIVPAAVISIGKSFGMRSAAITTAL